MLVYLLKRLAETAFTSETIEFLSNNNMESINDELYLKRKKTWIKFKEMRYKKILTGGMGAINNG